MIKLCPFLLLFITFSILNSGIICESLPEKNLIRERRSAVQIEIFSEYVTRLENKDRELERDIAKLDERVKKLEGESGQQNVEIPRYPLRGGRGEFFLFQNNVQRLSPRLHR